jgi:Aldos-2-ulose dehydratase, beta-propeller domain/FG-GAP-like repeat
MESERETTDHGRRTDRRQFLAAAANAVAAGVLPTLAAGAENRQHGSTREPPRWRVHDVAEIPHGYQLAVADVNADGRPDILALSSQESIVEWYESPSWKSRAITTRTKRNISLAPLFREGYPERGLALASDFALEESEHGGNIWWCQSPELPESEWTLGLIGQIPTSHRLRWADLNGDGRLALIDAPIVGVGAKPPAYKVGARLTWFEVPEILLRGHAVGAKKPAEWTAHLIDDTLTVVHGIQVLDWDGDRRDEILTASFEGVHLFHALGQGTDLRWKKTQLAAGYEPTPGVAKDDIASHRGSSEIGVGKVGGHRFIATIEPWHGDQLAVYFEDEDAQTGKLWNRHVIDSTYRDGHALACGDLDGDGSDEIVAGYRGTGTSLYAYYATGPLGTGWQRQELDNRMAASGVTLADINGDHRLDVVCVGASTGNVRWYENMGSRR